MSLHVVDNDLIEHTYSTLTIPRNQAKMLWDSYNAGRKQLHGVVKASYAPYSDTDAIIPTSNLLFTTSDKAVGIGINGNTYYLANLDDTAKKYPLMKFVYDIRDRYTTENKIPYQASTWTTSWKQSCDVLIDSSVIRPVSGTVYFRIRSWTAGGYVYQGFSIGPSTGNQSTRLWTSARQELTASNTYSFSQLMQRANPGNLQVLLPNQTYYNITSYSYVSDSTDGKRIFTIYWSPDLYEYR